NSTAEREKDLLLPFYVLLHLPVRRMPGPLASVRLSGLLPCGLRANLSTQPLRVDSCFQFKVSEVSPDERTNRTSQVLARNLSGNPTNQELKFYCGESMFLYAISANGKQSWNGQQYSPF